RSTQADAESVEHLLLLRRRTVGFGVKGTVLVIPEGTAVELIGAAAAHYCHIGHRPKGGVRAYGRHSELVDHLRGWSQLGEVEVRVDVDCGDAVDAEFDLERQSATDGRSTSPVLLHARRGQDSGEWAASHGAGVYR